MKKVKSLILRSRSMLNYLFFVVETSFNRENIKKTLRGISIVSSSVYHLIREAMVNSLQNGLIKRLLLKMHSLKNKGMR